MKNTLTTLTISLLLTQTPLLALEGDLDKWPEGPKNGESSELKGDVQFGYVMSSGNTETSNVNGKLNLQYSTRNWRHLMSLNAFSSSDDVKTTAERYKLDYQADRKFDEKSYFFSNLNYEEDRFSGYDYRSSLTAGYGYRFLNTDEMTFQTELGGGMRQSERNIIDPLNPVDTKENEAMVRVVAKHHWQIEEDRSLATDLTVDAGEESTISNFEIGFITMIAGDFSLKAAYTARHTSVVPQGKEKLDTVTSINLLYAF